MGPEEYQMFIKDEYKSKYTHEEIARKLAQVRIVVENAFWFADLDELGENLCPLLGLNSEELERSARTGVVKMVSPPSAAPGE